MSNSTASNSTDPADYCTLGTCPLSEANFTYVPNLPGNLVFLALFGALFAAQLVMGIRWKTWAYQVGLFGGLALEIVGYSGRVQLHYNPFPFNPFLEYLICLTIGPAFFSASIYICLGRIVTVYGESISRLRPRTYTIVFVICDLVSLVLQAAGGALTAMADDDQPDMAQNGIHIMQAGLSSQVVSMFIFVVLCADFAWRVHRNPHKLNPKFAFRELRESLKWKAFLFGLAAATVTIFTRCVFRVAELKDGFNGKLANDEIAFMILEGTMMSIAGLCMTIFHPGYCFGGLWDETKMKVEGYKQPSEVSLKDHCVGNMA